MLWNSGSGDYKDRNVKANAWEAVAKENSCTVEEAKKYWKNLRDKFVRERKQEDDSKRSGGSADSVYVSKWVHFKVLSFPPILSNTEPRPRTSLLGVIGQGMTVIRRTTAVGS